jgi:hypothetical protein
MPFPAQSCLEHKTLPHLQGPPKGPKGPQALAYCRVLKGGDFLFARYLCIPESNPSETRCCSEKTPTNSQVSKAAKWPFKMLMAFVDLCLEGFCQIGIVTIVLVSMLTLDDTVLRRRVLPPLISDESGLYYESSKEINFYYDQSPCERQKARYKRWVKAIDSQIGALFAPTQK